MLHQYFYAFIPVFGLLVNVLFQVVSFRCFKSLTLLKSVIAGFVVGGICIVIIEKCTFFPLRKSPLDIVLTVVTDLAIYAALGYCYFHFVNLGETARRVRILRELIEAREGLAEDEILARYNAKQIVTMRIDRLLHNGQIVEQEGRYIVGKPFMLLIARGMTWLKRFLLAKISEFDSRKT